MPLTPEQKAYSKEWRARNKDRVKAYNVAYQSRNATALAEKRRAYFNERDAAARRVKTAWVRAYLSEHPCVDCGETRVEVLEFDHVRGVKTATISAMRRGRYTLRRLQQEVEKCEVRCVPCHRRRTSALGRAGWMTAPYRG